MLSLILEKRITKFLQKLPTKQTKQIAKSLLALTENPFPHNSKKLIGYESYIRLAIGEYRIIYTIKQNSEEIHIILIDKRNDDLVYKHLKQITKPN